MKFAIIPFFYLTNSSKLSIMFHIFIAHFKYNEKLIEIYYRRPPLSSINIECNINNEIQMYVCIHSKTYENKHTVVMTTQNEIFIEEKQNVTQF